LYQERHRPDIQGSNVSGNVLSLVVVCFPWWRCDKGQNGCHHCYTMWSGAMSALNLGSPVCYIALYNGVLLLGS